MRTSSPTAAPSPAVTAELVERWRGAALISPDQAAAITEYERAHAPVPPTPVSHGPVVAERGNDGAFRPFDDMVAQAEFAAHGTPGKGHVLILLSDGGANRPTGTVNGSTAPAEAATCIGSEGTRQSPSSL